MDKGAAGCKLRAQFFCHSRKLFAVPFRRRRPHRLIALFALLGLLFQQAAMAAYVCPHAADGRAEAVAMTMPGCHQSASADRARCQAHCHPQAYSGDYASVPPVPALLPPTTWPRPLLHAVDRARGECRSDVTARAAAPPVTIRHCTFQI